LSARKRRTSREKNDHEEGKKGKTLPQELGRTPEGVKETTCRTHHFSLHEVGFFKKEVTDDTPGYLGKKKIKS